MQARALLLSDLAPCFKELTGRCGVEKGYPNYLSGPLSYGLRTADVAHVQPPICSDFGEETACSTR